MMQAKQQILTVSKGKVGISDDKTYKHDPTMRGHQQSSGRGRQKLSKTKDDSPKRTEVVSPSPKTRKKVTSAALQHQFAKIKTKLTGRVFLMLQGPQSNFFPRLANALVDRGATVIKVNLCGGDVFLWYYYIKHNNNIHTFNYHGKIQHFASYITELYQQFGVTDFLAYSDWRPFHQDAILIAKFYHIRVWVYEEGYLRLGFVTLEQNGVNGRSPLTHSPQEIRSLAKDLNPLRTSPERADTLRRKVIFAIMHHVGNVCLYVSFPFYRTHRAHNIFYELFGILPRYWHRKRRLLQSQNIVNEFLKKKGEFFFYPLQLNHDSQIQLYSPYIRQEEAISTVLYSFSKHAKPTSRLLIKNHPLDNGLIPYREIIKSMSTALGCADRVVYVEDGNTNQLLRACAGVVLINSTVGLSALLKYKKVFCLGTSIYAMDGLAQSFLKNKLDDFWNSSKPVDKSLVADFCKVLQAQSLVMGNFYNFKGSLIAVSSSIKRFANKAYTCITKDQQ